MVAASGRRGFTWIELLVVLVIVGILVVVLVPLIQTEREAARLARCTNNLKQIGLALHNHHDAQKRFPPSCMLTGLPDDPVQNGWSWLTLVYPFVECNSLYDALQLKKNPVPSEKDTPLGFTTEIQAYQCPSYSGPRFAFPQKTLPSGALTNYKAMGATHLGSLAQALGGSGSPPPKYKGTHPDGALYPGDGAKISSLGDGAASTVMACETVEQKKAIWCLGSTATLVGLPPSVSYAHAWAFGNFYAPAGFNGKYDEEGGTSDLLTYLRCDYEEDGPYISKQYRKGPGSEHPNVVNHLFGDGRVHSVNKDIDAALYFFVITKANGDPGSGSYHPSE